MLGGAEHLGDDEPEAIHVGLRSQARDVAARRPARQLWPCVHQPGRHRHALTPVAVGVAGQVVRAERGLLLRPELDAEPPPAQTPLPVRGQIHGVRAQVEVEPPLPRRRAAPAQAELEGLHHLGDAASGLEPRHVRLGHQLRRVGVLEPELRLFVVEVLEVAQGVVEAEHDPLADKGEALFGLLEALEEAQEPRVRLRLGRRELLQNRHLPSESFEERLLLRLAHGLDRRVLLVEDENGDLEPSFAVNGIVNLPQEAVAARRAVGPADLILLRNFIAAYMSKDSREHGDSSA
mmetsp:Transcript_14076/g.33366  ORF Transcript_14076/g.33366 Transcript_14076/m.33366 type:complete len:292 (+) Transcript_14076:352-1227(+)